MACIENRKGIEGIQAPDLQLPLPFIMCFYLHLSSALKAQLLDGADSNSRCVCAR